MSSRNTPAAKATPRAARQAANGSQAETRDPAAVALELVRLVLHGKSGQDLAAARALLPDGTPPDFTRLTALYLADLAAAVVTSEAATAGTERGAYLDSLIRLRMDGGGGRGDGG